MLLIFQVFCDVTKVLCYFETSAVVWRNIPENLTRRSQFVSCTRRTDRPADGKRECTADLRISRSKLITAVLLIFQVFCDVTKVLCSFETSAVVWRNIPENLTRRSQFMSCIRRTDRPADGKRDFARHSAGKRKRLAMPQARHIYVLVTSVIPLNLHQHLRMSFVNEWPRNLGTPWATLISLRVTVQTDNASAEF